MGLGNASFLRKKKRGKKPSKITYLMHTHTHTLLSAVTPLFCAHQILACLSRCSDQTPLPLARHNKRDGITVLLKAFAWQSNIVHLENKGIDPVHRRLDFLDKAVGKASPRHLRSIHSRRYLILKLTLQ